ncbi:MAG: sel1 repeat family protein [Gammaproteobacteria bacterium]|nr:sel1 repeat family protein [Gammaproteobacteria bacterium]NNJ96719.1 sel1 repeat family protein [Gammaproteobacteria bacterium]
MKTANIVLVLILPIFVLSCVSAPTSTDALISGQSRADAELQQNTMDIISVYVMASGCNRIDYIDTAVLQYDTRTGEKGHVWSKEQWMVTGCSRASPFLVTYAEDGGVGSFIKVAERGTEGGQDSSKVNDAEEAALQEAESAFKSGDYPKALALLTPLAERGNPRAQNGLAIMYARGLGVSTNLEQAFEWHEKSALQGYALAQFLLGLMHADGQAVPKDAAKGAKWLRAAAEQGLAVAQFNLGAMYARGEGVVKDSCQAAEWYRKAAELGYALAQHNLALQYLSGDGVTQNHAEAFRWEQEAAEQGDANAQFGLGILYAKGRDGVPQNYNKAFKWIAKAAEQGQPLHFKFEPGWKIGRYVERPNQHALEFIREGDDIDNWKELLSIQILPPFWGGPSAQDALEKLKALQEQICPGVTIWNVIDKDEKSILYEWQARPCRSWPDQHEVARIMFGKDKTYKLRYVQKTYQMPTELRDKWINKFMDAG